MRHAKSSWDDPQLSDHARPLNARGRVAAVLMRQAMIDFGLTPDVVLVSSSRRTLQTLAALEPWASPPTVQPTDALYLASSEQLLDAVRAVAAEARCVLVLGHNPGMHDFATALVAPAAMIQADPLMRRLAEGYPTGALAEFAVDAPWAELRPGGGRLARFIAPRDLEPAA